MVADQDPKKSQQTRAVSMADMINVKFSSLMLSSMNVVESKLTPISIPAGRDF